MCKQKLILDIRRPGVDQEFLVAQEALKKITFNLETHFEKNWKILFEMWENSELEKYITLVGWKRDCGEGFSCPPFSSLKSMSLKDINTTVLNKPKYTKKPNKKKRSE